MAIINKRNLLKYLFILLVMAVFVPNLKGQKISKYYTSKLQDDGELYFIFPHEEFYSKETNGELEYDLTYLSSRDSVILNFSYEEEQTRKFESITLKFSGKSIESKVKRLFVESKKNKWHYRYSSKFLFKDLMSLYNSENAPVIMLHDVKSKDVNLIITKSKWKKHASINRKIFELIEYNH